MGIVDLLKDTGLIAVIDSPRTLLRWQIHSKRWIVTNTMSPYQILYRGPSEEEAVAAFIKNEER